MYNCSKRNFQGANQAENIFQRQLERKSTPPPNKASNAVNVSFIGLLPLLLGLKDILSIRKVYLWRTDAFQEASPVTNAYSGSDQLMKAGDETLYKCIHLPINPWIIRHYCHFITWTCHQLKQGDQAKCFRIVPKTEQRSSGFQKEGVCFSESLDRITVGGRG